MLKKTIEALDWQDLLICPYEIINQSRDNSYSLFLVMEKDIGQVGAQEVSPETAIYCRKCSSLEEARYFLKKKWSEHICQTIIAALQPQEKHDGK